jgi:hypothetical protein
MAVVVQRAHTPLLSMQNVDPSSCYQLEVISDNQRHHAGRLLVTTRGIQHGSGLTHEARF